MADFSWTKDLAKIELMHSFGLDKIDDRVVVVESFTDLGDARTWGTALHKYIVGLNADQWKEHYHVEAVEIADEPTEVVAQLLRAGVEVNAQARGNAVKGGAAIDVAGKTALALASMGGQTAIVDVLLAAGAQFEYNTRIPVFMRELEEQRCWGMQVDGAYNDSDTPLCLVRENHFGLIRDNSIELELLDAGASGQAVKLYESQVQEDRNKMYAAQESLGLRLQYDLEQHRKRGPPIPAITVAKRYFGCKVGAPLGACEQHSLDLDRRAIQQLKSHARALRDHQPIKQAFECKRSELHLAYTKERQEAEFEHHEYVHNTRKAYDLHYALAAEDVRGPWEQSRYAAIDIETEHIRKQNALPTVAPAGYRAAFTW